MDHFDDIGPSVVMASPGMMQSGLSRELFENWCTDKRNGCIIAGYCVEGTLAKVCYFNYFTQYIYIVYINRHGEGAEHWTTEHWTIGLPPTYVRDACHHSSLMF